MKVSELIAALQKYDPDTEVVIERVESGSGDMYEAPKPYWTRHIDRSRDDPNAMIVILGSAIFTD